jgi:hypothetical protein
MSCVTVWKADQEDPAAESSADLFIDGTPQVHTEETSEHSTVQTSYRTFAISGCHTQVERTRQVLELLTDDGRDNRLTSFDGCRSFAWFVRHRDSGKIRVASSRCGLRWCPLCIRTRRYIITQSVSAWLKTIEQPKFLTLTLKHTDSPLSQQIDDLYSFFKEFKRRKFFKKRLIGGVWFFQVKKSATDGMYHPHLHILFEGRYLPHDEVSAIWSKITHGSSVVDIRAINNARKAVDYVARYASAPCDLAKLDVLSGLEVVSALHGRRIVGTFGTGSVVKFTAQKPDDAEAWENMGTFWWIHSTANQDDEALEVLNCWKSGERCNVLPKVKPPPDDFTASNQSAEPESFRQGVLGFMAI